MNTGNKINDKKFEHGEFHIEEQGKITFSRGQ